jgi:MarC family integral membrane protein
MILLFPAVVVLFGIPGHYRRHVHHYLSLVYAKTILKKVGPQGIDAATRIAGFLVSAMGVGLIFHGIVEFLQSYGVLLGGSAGH